MIYILFTFKNITIIFYRWQQLICQQSRSQPVDTYQDISRSLLLFGVVNEHLQGRVVSSAQTKMGLCRVGF